jgi:hypothetical protein
MAERSSLNQTIQIGVETTPGTAVAANKRLQSIGIEPSISVETNQFRPIGTKYNALSTLGKEWVEAAITGRGTYTELQYLLSSVGTTAVITTPGGGTTSRQWVFSPSTTADDVPKTFTVEHGSGVRADRFTYGLVTEFGMSFSRDGIEVTGSMLGRALEDAITLTASPTTNALVPILPTQVTCFLDTTAAGLGTTKLTRLISGEFSMGSRFGPVWILDAANPGFVNHVETEPDLSCTLLLQADTQGMGLLTNLRAGDVRFLRIECLGAIIEAAIRYKFTIDLAISISDTGGFSDADGVYAIEFSGIGVHDGTWGKAVQFTMVNTSTAL